MKWNFDKLQFANYGAGVNGSNFTAAHVLHAFENDRLSLRWKTTGNIQDKEGLVKALEEIGWRCFIEHHESDSDRTFMFKNGEHVLAFDWNKNHYSGIDLYVTDDRDLLMKTSKVVVPFVKDFVKDDGSVYSIVSTPDGLETMRIGKGSIEYIPDNYTSDVLEQFDLALADLQSEDPIGRMLILEGPPGTGKTMLTRAIIGLTQNSKHYVIPPDLIPQLGSPAFVPLLVNMAGEKKGKSHPSIFFLEDADNCLAPRMGDNMSYISALLNLTDGIIGRMIDIRFVVTTNAKRAEMDDAILRPGRLSQYIKIGYVPGDQASRIYSRLTNGKEKKYRDEMTLAEIYADAAGANIKTVSRKKVGF